MGFYWEHWNGKRRNLLRHNGFGLFQHGARREVVIGTWFVKQK